MRDDSGGVGAVLRGGSSERHRPIEPRQLLGGELDDRELGLLDSLPLRSGMIVPLAARGRTLAALTLATTRRDRPLGAEELLLAEEPLAACAVAAPDAVAARLERIAGVDEDTVLGDDVAILVVHAAAALRAERRATLRAVRPRHVAGAR